MKPLRIVIYGGSGFIGTRLTARLLKAGHEVRIADKAKSKKYPELWMQCDVRDLEQTTRACQGMDLIYNLAAEHADNVSPLELYYQTNVNGAEVVCKAAEAAGIDRIIFTSSVAIYGIPESELDESAPPNPFNEYGRTKILAEEVYQKWNAADDKRRLTIIRPTVVFGESNRGNFYQFLKQLASSNFIMIGNGKNRKSIAYVENVAAFLEYVIPFEAHEEIYNYVDPHDLDMNDMVVLVRTILGKPPKISCRLPYWLGYNAARMLDCVACVTGRKLTISGVRVKKFCGSTLFSSKKAMSTGFVPPVNIREGLEQVIKAEFLEQASPPAT